MKNRISIHHGIVLALALTASLPVSADEQTAHDKSAETIVAPAPATAPDSDALQGLEAPAAGAAPGKPETAEKTDLPYVTFDGASTPN